MRVGLYLRVSTAEQAERYSLPAQRRLLVEFCERQGWSYEIYEDAGISGETIDARPEMRRLLQDVIARKFDIVLAVEMERFSRSRDGVDLAFIKRLFREAGVRFGTPAQLFDPQDVEDDFVSGLLGLLASREKQKIVERTTRGREEAARRGRYVSGQIPFGYRRGENGTLTIHEPEARTVRLIFDLLANGKSTRAIVRELNAREIPTARGVSRWTRGTVLKILRNPTFGGTAYYRRQRVVRRDGRRRTLRWRDESQWIGVPVPQIVEEETFRQAGIRLRQNVVLSRRRQKRFYLLKGLVRCGVCGHTMVGKGSPPHWYYTCAASDHVDRGLNPRCRWHAAPARRLETLVWEQVKLALQHPDVVLAEARRYRESRLGQRDEVLMRLEYLRAALRELPEERERIQTLFREGYANLDEVRTHLDRVERKQATLEEERRTLEARLAFGTADEHRDSLLEHTVACVASRLGQLTDSERFDVVHACLERVVVGVDQSIEIHGYVAVRGEKEMGYVQAAWRGSIEK
jgi:site-specific DNA recombinase